ncbi:hypothetical protein [Macrococcus armenti]|uniref:hypothetical protein n=1 Tax=Macrococcus armenti TaxID=2875764 RepID=UPI001CCC45E9|nr:hypothetical protein [Macrococcus armenti]UBH15666.1 hypothetical protein LAU44_01535 [Macrococcus armenti]UBH20292.1 hypothetical protein LAU40_01535 [Macrococcus armenti]
MYRKLIFRKFHLKTQVKDFLCNTSVSFTEFKVTQGDHIAISGMNQSGKSTFIKQIKEQNLKGYYSENIKIGYFAQDISNIDINKTVLENAMKDTLQDIHLVRNILGSLGFNIDKMNWRLSYFITR